MNVLQENEFIYNFVYVTLDKFILIARVLMALGVLVYLLYSIFHNTREDRADYRKVLFKIAFTFIALVTYKWWTVEIATLIIGIAKNLDAGNLSNIYKVIGNAFKSRSGIETSLIKPDVMMMELIYWLLLMACLFFVKAATLIFELIQFFIQAILWLLGPIAIVISLFPNFKDAWVRWFNNFVAVAFWSVIYIILVAFFNNLMAQEFEQLLVANASLDLTFDSPIIVIELLVYTVVFFVSIVFIPWYTSIIIPGQNLGGMASMIGAGSLMMVSKIIAPIARKLQKTSMSQKTNIPIK